MLDISWFQLSTIIFWYDPKSCNESPNYESIGPQSHYPQAKLGEIPDILLREYVMLGGPPSSLAPHIVRSVSTGKLPVPKQKVSRPHLSPFSQLPNFFVLYAPLRLHFIEKHCNCNLLTLTELHMCRWNRSTQDVLLLGYCLRELVSSFLSTTMHDRERPLDFNAYCYQTHLTLPFLPGQIPRPFCPSVNLLDVHLM